MARSIRHATGFALVAFALVGCGGTGTQPTSLDENLDLSSVVAYPDSVTSSTSLEVLSDGTVEKPLAEFKGGSNNGDLVIWGGRDATTKLVTSVHEGAYTSDKVSSPIYIKYDANGGISSVFDSDTKSYLTLSQLEPSNNSIVATGYDGKNEKAYTVRATYSNDGVTVQQIDPATGLPTTSKAQSFSKAALQSTLAQGGLKSRGMAGDANDALAGFTSVYKDSSGEGTRTLILTAVFKAAAALLKDQKDFGKVINDTAGFLLLNQLENSYAAFYAKSIPTLAPDSITSQPYRTDLPDPISVPYPGS